jgi:hypothetical protein
MNVLLCGDRLVEGPIPAQPDAAEAARFRQRYSCQSIRAATARNGRQGRAMVRMTSSPGFTGSFFTA